MIHPNTTDIKHYFIDALANEEFVTDRTGQKTIEMIGASFMADKPAIFGTTKEFLNSHNLVSLNQLPKLDDISEFSELEKRQLGLLDNEQLDSEQRSSDVVDSDEYNSENIH